ncbi:hypothetical protein [Carbonactinospora thermoautotrophica]
MAAVAVGEETVDGRVPLPGARGHPALGCGNARGVDRWPGLFVGLC